jgi:glycogen debranching enzyme
MANILGSYLVSLRPRTEHLQVSQGRTVLVTGRAGFVDPEHQDGLFVHQTRLLSKYIWSVNGERLRPVALSNVEQHNWLGYYILAAPGVDGFTDEGSGEMENASEATLEVLISRFAGEGIHEDLDLTNFTLQPIEFDLELEFDADFAEHSEVDREERKQKGTLKTEWRGEVAPGRWEFAFDYHVRHHYSHQGDKGDAEIHRGLTLQIEKSGSVPKYRNHKITFHVQLGPRQTWHTCVNLLAHIDGQDLPLHYRCKSFSPQKTEYDRKRQIFLHEATGFETLESQHMSATVLGTLNQAREDLMALRLFDMDHSDRDWVMGAGLPLYLALFGRDTLTSAWMASILSAGMMSGVLAELAKWQGTRVDDWRDEDPGRMLHEAHTGPLEKLNFNPRARYYGSVTTSGFYPFVVSELWHWTGDLETIKPFVEPTMKAIAWKATHDLDGDGLFEYQTRSEQGTKNQAWKDSWDAIVYEDGKVVDTPIAASEEQAFFYVAKLQFSEILYWLDRKDEARKMFDEAEELRKRINDRFWMPDENFYAMALDPKNRQVRSIASNAGHLIACGVPDKDMVRVAADRLMSDELYSGWAVRTLSNRHPAFNPYSYHRGSVWPVEQGAFALGFARYGLYEHLHRLCKSIFEAAAIFDFHRLPEVFSGHSRDEAHPFPAFYPKSCYPQAWSAAATFAMIQAMLGIYPYAPMNMLLVDPHLPDWLPNFTVRNLKVGKAAIDIRFYRDKSGFSDYQILDLRGSLHVLRQPSPWSLTATWSERIKEMFMSLLPGK